MSGIQCHRCGRSLREGSLKYRVAVSVRSMFDGVIPPAGDDSTEEDLSRIMAEISAYNEEELARQVYEDDEFIMCPACKEQFLDDIYSHMRPKASPERGRAHLIH